MSRAIVVAGTPVEASCPHDNLVRIGRHFICEECGEKQATVQAPPAPGHGPDTAERQAQPVSSQAPVERDVFDLDEDSTGDDIDRAAAKTLGLLEEHKQRNQSRVRRGGLHDPLDDVAAAGSLLKDFLFRD